MWLNVSVYCMLTLHYLRWHLLSSSFFCLIKWLSRLMLCPYNWYCNADTIDTAVSFFYLPQVCHESRGLVTWLVCYKGEVSGSSPITPLPNPKKKYLCISWCVFEHFIYKTVQGVHIKFNSYWNWIASFILFRTIWCFCVWSYL